MGKTIWSLEVVRGKTIGQLYFLLGRETVLGSNLNGEAGIELGDQEGDSPRKMAPRQALIASIDELYSIRDLDSPGGTFINRQRLLPDQSRPLHPGDLIQLGSVQLRMVETSALAGSAENPGSLSYSLPWGSVCRSWDDFLIVASQRWSDLRDELASGRIDTWLTSLGRVDLVISGPSKISPDDRLDAWLAILPTTHPARAELDVPLKRLIIRVTPGGGTTLKSVAIANVGHRLLRITAMITPLNLAWIKLGDSVSGRTQTVIDSFNLPIEISIPEHLSRPQTATLWIEGNGGSQSIEVILEPKDSSRSDFANRMSPDGSRAGFGVWLAQISYFKRWVVLGLGGLVLRGIVSLSDRMTEAVGSSVINGERRGLLAPLIIFAALMALSVAGMAVVRGKASLAFHCLISGAVGGSAVAAIIVATCRGLEPLLGDLASNPFALGLLWALMTFLLTTLSAIVFPVTPRSAAGEASG